VEEEGLIARTRFTLGALLITAALGFGLSAPTMAAAQKPSPVSVEQIRAVAALAADDDMLDISADGTITVIKVAQQIALSAADATSVSAAGEVAPSESALKAGKSSTKRSGPTPQVVIGPNNLVKVSNTTLSPYRMLGLWTGQTGNLLGFCTAWLYGSNMIAFAAHCVQDGPSAPYFWSVTFKAGYDEPTAPYGTCALANLFVPAGWFNNYTLQYDFAAIKLNCSVGSTTGGFNLYNWNNFDTDGRGIYVTGYPKGFTGTLQMYYSREPPNIQDDYSFYLTYQVDTAGGDSGAPVYRWASDTINGCTNLCVFGIHHGGTIQCVPGVPTSGDCNYGRKITTGVYDFLQAARTG